MPEQLTVEEFAKSIKTKYPQYAGIPDAELTQRMIAKYPQYKDKVRMSNVKSAPPSKSLVDSRRAASTSEFQANRPDFTKPGYAPLKTVLDAPLDVGVGIERMLGLDPLHPIASSPGAFREMLSGLAKLGGSHGPMGQLEVLKGMVQAPVSAVQEGAAALRDQNLPEAMQAVGAGYVAAAPIEGAASVAADAVDLGGLRNKARELAQRATGSSAFKTTEPIVDKYLENKTKASKAQADVDAAVQKTNLEARRSAQQKNIEKQSEYRKDVAAADSEADVKTAANRDAAAGTLESNREAGQVNSRREAITRSLKEGSQKLGERVKNLDSKIRTEANEKYGAVRAAVRDDPGVPLTDLAQAARHAEENILKGSSENIKQFRELARKSAEEQSGPRTNIGFDIYPGSSLFERLMAEGAIDTGGNITFDQLQGYSSEIGTKLAKGGLPGDIYQALKYLKDKIDTAKSTIADRNGAGAALRNADGFWRSYMDLFYDSDSAIAKVRENVGTVDPEFHADPFTKGKAGDVAIGRLKQLKTQHAADANSVADLARNLRSASSELETLKPGTIKPVEAPARISPKDVDPPRPVPTKTTPREIVPKPEVPTAGDIIDAKKTAVQSTAANLGKLTKYDIPILAGSVIGTLIGGWARAAGLATEAVRFGVPDLLSRPRVIEWIAKPTASDLAVIDKLPEAARAELRQNLQAILEQERAGGRRVNVSPAIQRLIGQSGIAAGAVQNRRDALERLGRAPQ